MSAQRLQREILDPFDHPTFASRASHVQKKTAHVMTSAHGVLRDQDALTSNPPTEAESHPRAHPSRTLNAQVL